jgi:hypothetical protein
MRGTERRGHLLDPPKSANDGLPWFGTREEMQRVSNSSLWQHNGHTSDRWSLTGREKERVGREPEVELREGLEVGKVGGSALVASAGAPVVRRAADGVAIDSRSSVHWRKGETGEVCERIERETEVDARDPTGEDCGQHSPSGRALAEPGEGGS